jgi:hypothetical protein
MVDDGDDMVNKIQEAFGIKPKSNSNFTNVETAEALHNKGLEYAAPQSAKTDTEVSKLMNKIRTKVLNKMQNGEIGDDDDERNYVMNKIKKYNISESELQRFLESNTNYEQGDGSDVGIASADRYLEDSKSYQDDDSQHEGDLFGDIPKDVVEDMTGQLETLSLDVGKAPLGKDEAASRLAYNYRKYKGKQLNKQIKEDMEYSTFLNDAHPTTLETYTTGYKYGGIDWLERTPEVSQKIKAKTYGSYKKPITSPSGEVRMGGKKLDFSDDRPTPPKLGRPLGSTNKTKLGMKETFGGT